MFQKEKALFYNNSPYLNREAIGTEEVVKNIPVTKAKAFYKRWYHPELMHFIAVGDFNTTEITQKIKETFSELKKSEKTLTPTPRVVKENNTTRIFTVWDKEYTSNRLESYYMDEQEESNTKEDMRRGIIEEMVLKLFNLKAAEQIEKANPKASLISLSSSSLNKNRGFYQFSTVYKDGDELAALKELYELIWGFNKDGFSEEAINYVKENLLNNNEKSYKRVHDQTSSSLSYGLLFYAQSKSTFIDYDVEYKLQKEIIPTITAQELKSYFQKIVHFKDRVLLFKSSHEQRFKNEEVLKTIEKAKQHPVDVLKGKKLPKSLAVEGLKAKKIVAEHDDNETDTHEFTLENEVKILFKKTDFTKERIILSAFSFGGESLYEAPKLLTVQRSTLFVSNSGVGAFSQLDLQKILANKSVSVSTDINARTESLSASANKDDLESLFALLYRRITEPKIDPKISHNIKVILKNNVAQALNNPKVKFNREFQRYYHMNYPRIQFETNETIERLNDQEMLAIYKNRFSDFNDFTFLIVGDTTLEEIKKWSQLYLGNLPSSKRHETLVKREVPYRKGEQEFTRNYNKENISNIKVNYESKIPFSPKNSMITKALKKVLNIRLRKLIREKNSGVYSISVHFSLDSLEVESSATLYFSCDPERKEELLKLASKVIENIKKEPITKEELSLFKENFQKNYTISLRQNGFWLSNLSLHYKLNLPLNFAYELPKIAKEVTEEDVLAMAKRFFTKDKILIELNPKEKKD
jgi:zinc protease